MYNSIVRQLDKIENESRPTAAIDTNTCEFKNVRFMKKQSSKITLRNTGKVYCTYKFIPKVFVLVKCCSFCFYNFFLVSGLKLDQIEYCKSWIKVDPAFGILEPSEAVEITIEICVDAKHVRDFNSKKEKLDEILVLEIGDGQNFFV